MTARFMNVVFAAPDGEWVEDHWEGGQRGLAQFYADLLGWTDLIADDVAEARQQADRLGAIRLRDMGGTCAVFGDPAGHPFCFCGPGE